MTQPADTGGAETQICYLFVADATAHCARAKAAGAEIVLDIEDGTATGAATPAATSKGTSGISAPTIRGGGRLRLPAKRADTLSGGEASGAEKAGRGRGPSPPCGSAMVGRLGAGRD